MNNKAIELKLLCFFIHVYLQAICEMIKYFASLIRGAPLVKNSDSWMHSWWWPLSIKTPALCIDRGRVSFLADLTC